MRRPGCFLVSLRSVKPRVLTSQSSVNFPKILLKTARTSAKHLKKQDMRAVFALLHLLLAQPVEWIVGVVPTPGNNLSQNVLKNSGKLKVVRLPGEGTPG